ncbi:hypothetical protein BCR32DRAFT_286527 [Anaeromyces robustus]|uniref:Eukaryotic translation initiation factor 3 subunit L n=1 Tax=Anaeromyces robustus TaxID=1754192 RepID=A0A1Y1VWL9_9FUNG|nr:hypothetical protein BCR32DRAFT_286527 [Anaeromyces robustus]|eukprot:ORX65386.1 hypothetical protein BCR32DRAFT_286527 [Anaeromyces robustus]
MFYEDINDTAKDGEIPAAYSQDDEFDEDFQEELVQYKQQQQQQEVKIPPDVKKFISNFYKNLVEHNYHDFNSIYEYYYNKLTEQYYQKQRWPEAEVIAPLVNNDVLFLILYKELYYRHVYAKLTPIINDRFNSYLNYCDLFNYILAPEKPVDLELPNQWLWDIIDEFIYQFQSFCQYRSKVKSKNEIELKSLRERPDIWNVHNVLNVLYSLIQKSNINEQLLVTKNGGDMIEAAGEFGSKQLYKMLGYFSIIGLLRVHCLLGDYSLALKMMENVELHNGNIFLRVTACQVTTYYYVGFAYMMMRRYSDAIKVFTSIIHSINRTKNYKSLSYQYEATNKKSEQMYALLAICITLCPTGIDEETHSHMIEKYGEQLSKMQKGDLKVFEELFTYACPKFINPAVPNYDIMENTQMKPTLHQCKIFIEEINNQYLVPTIRSYLKLYKTLDIQKLGEFLDYDSIEKCKNQLILFKHKTYQRKWEGGDLMSGEYTQTTDIDFYLKQDMIHIKDSKKVSRVSDLYIKQINKLEDMITNIKK